MLAELDYTTAAPDAYNAVVGLEVYLATQSGLDKRLIHLLKLRASQINGCAYCVDLHTKEARSHGLNEQWIALVSVWREAQVFDEQERALLAWTEALTNLNTKGAPKTELAVMREHFTDEDITKLSVAIGTINLWNRLAVGFGQTHTVD